VNNKISKQAAGNVKILKSDVKSITRQIECRLKKSGCWFLNLSTISSCIGFIIAHLARSVAVATIRVRIPVIHEKIR
jgi:hypothetical protein